MSTLFTALLYLLPSAFVFLPRVPLWITSLGFSSVFCWLS